MYSRMYIIPGSKQLVRKYEHGQRSKTRWYHVICLRVSAHPCVLPGIKDGELRVAGTGH